LDESGCHAAAGEESVEVVDPDHVLVGVMSALSPVLGQGAGAGFEDAAMLAELLTTPGMAAATALASFERMRKPEAQSLQRLSYDTSRMMTTTSAPSVIYANRGNLLSGV
jgi:FAD-dependent urate hydroxylase